MPHHTSTHPTNQSAGEADNGDGVMWRLRDVQQIVEQALVLVVGKLVKLVQHKHHTLIRMCSCLELVRKWTLSVLEKFKFPT